MKKYTFIDPISFWGLDYNVEDKLDEITRELKLSAENKGNYVSQVLVNKTGDSLFFGIILERKIGEPSEKYKVTVTKLKEE
jgi:hypothetical protein